MGNEVKGAVRVGDQRHQGKILLETSEIIFRGADFRLRIPFAEMRDVSGVMLAVPGVEEEEPVDVFLSVFRVNHGTGEFFGLHAAPDDVPARVE